MKADFLVTNKHDIKVGYKTALFRGNRILQFQHLINFLRGVILPYASQIFHRYKLFESLSREFFSQ